jgi:hypothetical protein
MPVPSTTKTADRARQWLWPEGDRLLLPRILPAKKEKTVCGRAANGLDHSAVLAVLSCVRESK